MYQEKCNWIEISDEIDLDVTLQSGQVFNFIKTTDNEHCGFVGEVLLILKQIDNRIYCKKINENVERAARIFFNLDHHVDVGEHHINGLKFLTNDFIATVFTFICSQNNNVRRITKMVQYLHSKGTYTEYQGLKIYKFPDVSKLTNIEEELQANGFGYRSRYITAAAKHITKNRDIFTKEFMQQNYERAVTELTKISGIGRKVADCVCLISLEYFDVVPLDVHIHRHSKKLFNLPDDKLTPRRYKTVQKQWIEMFGQYAGVYQLHIFKKYLDKSI